MQKTKQTSTKLLVIAITAAAIMAAVTTTSLSAATPAFAKRNCNEDNSICSGGLSNKAIGSTIPGGSGGHRAEGQDGSSVAQGGEGFNGFLGDQVGGSGFREVCDSSAECTIVGGSGQHTE